MGHERISERQRVGLQRGRLTPPEFLLGDGIEHVQTTADGAIWTGYFDEGVFGNGPGERSPPIGASGLVRWNVDGAKEWEYDPPAGAEPIADCYGLNVADDACWAYYYADYALARVGADGGLRVWRQLPVHDAVALAVDTEQVWLVSRRPNPLAPARFRRADNPRLTVLDIARDVARNACHFDLFTDTGEPLAENYVTGRGQFVHVFQGPVWYRLDVRSL